jgi:GNAT superfamily N-acetyltransferase
MSIIVTPLVSSNRSEWEILTREYNAFYQANKSPEDYDLAWLRLVSEDGVRGLVAKADGKLVGLAHFLFHTSTWAKTVCYLQDLYTAPSARGNGVARALINAVAEQARVAGATRFYWLTRENNAVARVLYEKVAKHNGFIRYEYPLATDA